MKYYLAIKKNETMPFTTTWMQMETINTKGSQSEREKQIPYDITSMWSLKMTQINLPAKQNRFAHIPSLHPSIHSYNS